MKKSYLYLMIAVVMIAIAALAYFSMNGGSTENPLVAFDNQPVSASVMALLSVPSNVSSSVGIGLASYSPLKKVSGPNLTINGKPEILYIGSDFCPYCAMQRWGLVVALMKFGNFTGLEYMTSAHEDIGPDTPTFTFINATYSSPYLVFVSRELAGNKIVDGKFEELQTLNGSQTAIIDAFDPRGYIPFTDFANKSAQVGANYNDLSILANKNWTVIAAELHNSSSVISRALVGAANLFTAQICQINNNTPSSVCGQAYIATIEDNLK
jgi:hypothetical protein